MQDMHQINRLYALWMLDEITDAEFVLWARMIKDNEKAGNEFFHVPPALFPVAQKLYLMESSGTEMH